MIEDTKKHQVSELKQTMVIEQEERTPSTLEPAASLTTGPAAIYLNHRAPASSVPLQLLHCQRQILFLIPNRDQLFFHFTF